MHDIRPSLPRLEAALFDLDGTIVDTERLLYLAWTELVRRAGADFSTFDYATIIGRPDHECCRMVAAHYGLVRDPAEWYAEYRAIFFAMMDKDLELRPGARDLIVTLDDLRVPMAVVTSAMGDHAYKALARFGLLGRFRHVVAADTPGLAARKPDPAPYLMGASLVGKPPDRCVAFEDSPSGVRSARAAGCCVVAVPHERSPAANLGEAHVVIASLEDFPPDVFVLS